MARSKRLLLGASAALAFASVAACQQLLGLDVLKNCDETPCIDAGAANDATTDGQVDTGADVVAPDAGDATLPPFPDGSTGSDWITFRMPWIDGGNLNGDAGLTFENRFNPAEQQRFTFSDGGKVAQDLVSLRGWLVASGSFTTSSFESAAGFCTDKGARLPTRIELMSVLDPTEPLDGGMIRRELSAARHFTNPVFWSATATRNDGGFTFWIVDFGRGKSFRAAAIGGAEYGVLCVQK